MRQAVALVLYPLVRTVRPAPYCSRCVANKEPHLCTTEWTSGYNPSIHRRYPRKVTPPGSFPTVSSANLSTALSASQPAVTNGQTWLAHHIHGHDVPTRFNLQDSPNFRRSFSTASTVDTPEAITKELRPSSNNVDFITQGRSEYTDVTIGSLLSHKDAYERNKALMDQNLNQVRPNYNSCAEDAHIGGFSPAARAVEVFHLRSLLPNKDQVFRMVDYHGRFMLYWAGGVYHAPSFRKALLLAYGQSDELDFTNLDWRWMALLYSILSSSVIGAPEAMSTAWGYSTTDKVRLAKQWGNATIACLQLGDYASKYHIYSVQAILNMHTSEHLVGSTKEWAVYQNAAIQVARGLGLHRLGPHPDDGKSAELTGEQKEALIQREMGRRVWYALASQDWLCSTSQGLYNIQQRHFTTIKPGHYDEETMTPITDGTPTYAHISNYLNDVAYLLVCYHDDMLDASDLATKYTVVLRYDARMRAISADKMPACLSPKAPFCQDWPPWVAWSRRLHQASWAHKIIMIHQAFLGRSFKQPQYTYSRWACCNAAKITIEQLSYERDPEEPQWWVEQAFVVTAGICLALDIFHRPEKDPELGNHRMWIEKAIKTLDKWPTSSIANHGNRLLNSLLQEYSKKFEASRPNQPPSESLLGFPENIAPASIAHAASESAQAQPLVSDGSVPPEPWPCDIDMTGWDDLMDTIPLGACLDNDMFLDNMLTLANSQYFR